MRLCEVEQMSCRELATIKIDFGRTKDKRIDLRYSVIITVKDICV